MCLNWTGKALPLPSLEALCHIVVGLFLPYYYGCWVVTRLLVETQPREHSLGFHHELGFLSIPMGSEVVADLLVGLAYNCDQEVAKYDGHEEDVAVPYGPGQVHVHTDCILLCLIPFETCWVKPVVRRNLEIMESVPESKGHPLDGCRYPIILASNISFQNTE